MKLSSAIVVALTGQILLGTIIHAVVALLLRPGMRKDSRRRRRWAAWAMGSRALRRLAPIWLPLFVLAVLPHGWTVPWLFLLSGALPTSGCIVMVHAAVRERRGALRSARLQVRLAGVLTFFGSLGLLAVVWTDLVYRVPFRRAVLTGSPITVTVGVACIGIGAFVALLAGLSQKPRPSAYFAALLYFAGLCSVVMAHHVALPGTRETHPSTVVLVSASGPAVCPTALNRPGSRLD